MEVQISLTQQDSQKIQKWLQTEIYPAIVERQLADPEMAPLINVDSETGVKTPYMGAIGGGLTFEITPTGLGNVTKVMHLDVNGAEQRLDLTDYDSW